MSEVLPTAESDSGTAPRASSNIRHLCRMGRSVREYPNRSPQPNRRTCFRLPLRQCKFIQLWS